MEPVLGYLKHIGLISPQDSIEGSDTLQVCRLRRAMGTILKLRIVYSTEPFAHFSMPKKGECVIYVFDEPDVLYASVTHTKQSIIELMYKDILLLHVEGVLCEYMYRDLCSYVNITRSGDEDTDRLNVIDTCMRDIGTNPPIYHCESNDPLISLGVEYVSAVYMPLISHNVTLHNSIYIVLSQEVVSSIKFVEPDED
jgi:hypothetical protein